MTNDSDKRLADMRCLITGGSRGLGRALVLAFTRAGAKVAYTFHRRADEAEETRAQAAALGAEPLVFQGSVADAAHVAEVVRAVREAWGGIDVLVNNAAHNQIVPIGLLEEDDWDYTMAVNVKGPYLFARACLKPMIKARRGHIVNIGSFGAERAFEAPAHYAASKGALLGFTRALAAEMGRYGVQVNYVAPGLLDTGMGDRLPAHRRDEYVGQTALGRLGSADEVAETIAWLVSGQHRFITGAPLVIDGGL